MPATSIDIERLWSTIQELGEIGSIEGGGRTREDGTEEDKEARDLVISWFEDADLEVTVDPIGNIIARREGREDEEPVRTGSHIDTARNGGKFDGTLGVLAPLEIVRTWNESDVETTRPVEIIVFSLEEMSRFRVGMLGSQVVGGKVALEEAYQMEDDDGITLKEAFEDIGYIGERDLLDFTNAHSFVEMHIEQGPVLETLDIPVGIVESVTGITGHRVTLTGNADHAGGTPMDIRRDAFMATAEFATDIEELARKRAEETTAVATVGRLEIEPNGFNAVPGEVIASVDIRDTDHETLDELIETGRKYVTEAAEKRNVDTEWEELYYRPPTAMDDDVIQTIENAATGQNIEYNLMPSGGGHDAMNIADDVPTGMIFVTSEDGISHAPEEYTPPEDIERGTEVLERTLIDLAN